MKAVIMAAALLLPGGFIVLALWAAFSTFSGGNNMKVTVAAFQHRYGTELRAFATPEGAEAWRREIAREWWDAEMPDDWDKPIDPGVVADDYFEYMGEHPARFEIFNSETVEVTT